jgi:hypothetical protein
MSTQNVNEVEKNHPDDRGIKKLLVLKEIYIVALEKGIT